MGDFPGGDLSRGRVVRESQRPAVIESGDKLARPDHDIVGRGHRRRRCHRDNEKYCLLNHADLCPSVTADI